MIAPMPESFRENLSQLARENFAIAERTCVGCDNMQVLWPYIRLARASTGTEGTSSALHSILTRLMVEGRRSVLVAGSQDTGLLALVARAAEKRAIDITILDRCVSPLNSCRRLAQEWLLPIETLHQDLTAFETKNCFDIVLVHGTLHYIPAERRSDVLARLRQAMRSDGRLILLFNTRDPLAEEAAVESRNHYADWVIGELRRIGVPLPEEPEAFAERLRVHAARREQREAGCDTSGAVRKLLAAAGLNVCDLFELGMNLVKPMQCHVATIAKRRFLVIAQIG